MTETPPRDPETGQFQSPDNVVANADDAKGSEGQTAANAQQVTTAASAIRAQIAALMGHSEWDARDIYETFDWKKRPSVTEYYAMYRSHPFAGPIVDRPAFTTWRDAPTPVDDPDTETDFEADVAKLFREFDLPSRFERVDRLAGIGRFGLTVFITTDALDDNGVVDEDRLAEPIEPPQFSADGLDNVVQIKQFSEVSVDGISWGTEEHAGEGRWGLPIQYDIDFSPEGDTDGSDSDSVWTIHHSRTVAVPATRRLDHDFFAPPRLESVFNILRDILKVMGSVAEMAYRGADKGLAISHDPEKVDVTSEQFWEQHDEEITEWFQGLKPVFETTGEVQELGGQIGDVSNIFDPQLSALATDTGIPKRVFEGDPAGALASASEDTQAYFGLIGERRTEYADPLIATSHVMWFVNNGLISSPKNDAFSWEWQPLRVLSETEQAELADLRIRAGRLSGSMTVDEAREELGLDPIGEPFGSMLLAEYQAMVGAGGGGGTPTANVVSALQDAVAEARQDGAVSARTESRIRRGQQADD
jgi:hypothetical protein